MERETAFGPPVWVAEWAGRFWADAGPPPPFPRPLEPLLPFAGPLVLLARPGLRVAAVVAHARARKLPVPAVHPDRPLRAALLCWRGAGYLFVDPLDPPDERRFSVAHELAHYLRDCISPREHVERAFGRSALDVLDGLRSPTDAERIHAVLRNRPLGPHTHFLSRDPAGVPLGEPERRAEADADRLAFELLAPAELFRHEPNAIGLAARLVSEFGLPHAQAREYAALLFPPTADGGFLAQLAKSL